MLEVLRATGLLRDFNRGGVLHAADVHVAQRLGSLAGEYDERALLALALAVRGVRNGSVVLDIDTAAQIVGDDDAVGSAAAGSVLPWPELEGWRIALDASPLVGGPLHREGDLVWLDTYWRQEVFLAEELMARAAQPVSIDLDILRLALARLWPGDASDDQRAAAAVCALSSVSVLGGGPGTGKTTTVARLLVALREASPVEPPLRIALAAPTGKAAARLREAVIRRDEVLSADEAAVLAGMASSTLHRLLGVRRGMARFWHHAGNRLPYDVVVVDEASMVSLTMFARLLEALRPDARLILVGDPDQLASVEAGAVLADLVAKADPPLRTVERAATLAKVVPHETPPGIVADSPGARMRDGIGLLHRVRRYDEAGPINRLAQNIRVGDDAAVLEVLRSGADGVMFDEVADVDVVPAALLRQELVDQAREIVARAQDGGGAEALAALGSHRLLCAHRQGLRGVAHWTQLIRSWLVQDLDLNARGDGRYAGQPLLVTSNDYDNKLWNGDVGVVVQEAGELVAVFGGKEGIPRLVPLGRLGDVRPMYAMTVHRSQGSQFPSVTVLLPPASSPLGTRETLYTAVTRAEKRVRVIGSAVAVAAAVRRPVQRASGLRRRLL